MKVNEAEVVMLKDTRLLLLLLFWPLKFLSLGIYVKINFKTQWKHRVIFIITNQNLMSDVVCQVYRPGVIQIVIFLYSVV